MVAKEGNMHETAELFSIFFNPSTFFLQEAAYFLLSSFFIKVREPPLLIFPFVSGPFIVLFAFRMAEQTRERVRAVFSFRLFSMGFLFARFSL